MWPTHRRPRPGTGSGARRDVLPPALRADGGRTGRDGRVERDRSKGGPGTSSRSTCPPSFGTGPSSIRRTAPPRTVNSSSRSASPSRAKYVGDRSPRCRRDWDHLAHGPGHRARTCGWIADRGTAGPHRPYPPRPLPGGTTRPTRGRGRERGAGRDPRGPFWAGGGDPDRDHDADAGARLRARRRLPVLRGGRAAERGYHPDRLLHRTGRGATLQRGERPPGTPGGPRRTSAEPSHVHLVQLWGLWEGLARASREPRGPRPDRTDGILSRSAGIAPRQGHERRSRSSSGPGASTRRPSSTPGENCDSRERTSADTTPWTSSWGGSSSTRDFPPPTRSCS